jgi:hypothetical protein
MEQLLGPPDGERRDDHLATVAQRAAQELPQLCMDGGRGGVLAVAVRRFDHHRVHSDALRVATVRIAQDGRATAA